MKISYHDFCVELKKTFQFGLNLNVLRAASITDLLNLVIDPENHVRENIICSRELIDKRRDERNLKTLKQSEDYQSIIASISLIKKMPNWPELIEATQIGRLREGYVLTFPTHMFN